MKTRSEISQYLTLFRHYWGSKSSLTSWGWVLTSFSFCALFVYLSVYMNALFPEIYDCIEKKDKSGLMKCLGLYGIALTSYLLCYSIKWLSIAFASFKWRDFLTQEFIKSWLSHKNYCFIKNKIDNPDQRIAEDIGLFCVDFGEHLLTFVAEFLTFSAFIGVLWRFSYPLEFTIYKWSFSFPHYIAIGCFIYALLLNYVIYRIGRPVIKLQFEKKSKEADFRRCLGRLNLHCEEVAFNQGEDFEREVFKKQFSKIRQNYLSLTKRDFSLNFLQFGYTSILAILPTIGALPLFFADAISFGALMQIHLACATILNALGVILSNYQTLAAIQAGKNRLYQFFSAIEQTEEHHKTAAGQIVTTDSDKIIFFDLSLSSNKNRDIVTHFNLEVYLGEKLLIMGKSGIGKTSILRALAKIWHPGKGKIFVPDEKMFFIPQRPYFPVGTLLECLSYPSQSIASNDDLVLAETLRAVGLEHIIPLLDQEEDFLKILSLGELQRLNFARAILHKPKILVMDEPTSSLDDKYEMNMFSLLVDTLPKETTIITVSHSKALIDYHDRVVAIDFEKSSNKLKSWVVS